MSITFPLDFPTITGIGTFSISLNHAVGVTRSPYSLANQVQNYGGKMWTANIGLPPTFVEESDEWEAFILSLGGSFGTFLLGDPLKATPRGAAASTPGTPLVYGSSNGLNTLDIKGCPFNVTGYLKKGDYFQLGSGGSSRLYRNLVNVDTDATGKANLLFTPNLRRPAIADEPLTLTNAQGVFRMSDNSTPFSRVPVITNLSFNAMEAMDGT